MKINVSSDSTCDLSPELIERYGISILPLNIIKDGKSYTDGLEITPDDIYAYTDKSGELCSTAAVSVAVYEDFFKKQLESCDEVVHFHISSDMSACYQNACIAASEIGHVYPVDARNLSTGIGQLVLDAAILADQGWSGEAIQKEMERRREKLDVSFLVSTLTYLRKGGRCSAVAAIGANLLSLKPCIEVREGVMGVGKKYRGPMGKCLVQYVHDRLADRDDIDLRRIFITHSGALSEEDIQAVKEEVLRCQNFEEVHITRAGGTISCHCGPGTLGILYYHK